MKRTDGFTLLEILVILAIIGILAGIVFSTLNGARARAAVRDTAQQIAADLNRARSSAQRTNRNTSLVLAADGLSYTLTLSGTASTLNLPAGLSAQMVGAGPAQATYNAPFGELDSNVGRIWKVSSTTATIYIKITGVTGKAGVYAN